MAEPIDTQIARARIAVVAIAVVLTATSPTVPAHVVYALVSCAWFVVPAPRVARTAAASCFVPASIAHTGVPCTGVLVITLRVPCTAVVHEFIPASVVDAPVFGAWITVVTIGAIATFTKRIILTSTVDTAVLRARVVIVAVRVCAAVGHAALLWTIARILAKVTNPVATCCWTICRAGCRILTTLRVADAVTTARTAVRRAGATGFVAVAAAITAERIIAVLGARARVLVSSTASIAATDETVRWASAARFIAITVTISTT